MNTPVDFLQQAIQSRGITTPGQPPISGFNPMTMGMGGGLPPEQAILGQQAPPQGMPQDPSMMQPPQEKLAPTQENIIVQALIKQLDRIDKMKQMGMQPMQTEV